MRLLFSVSSRTNVHTYAHTYRTQPTVSIDILLPAWFSGQYDEMLHECVQVFSVGEGKYCTRVQCLAILPTKTR